MKHPWTLALSVGPNAMNEAGMRRLAMAQIPELELSSGKLAPFYEDLQYPVRAKEYSALAASHGLAITSIHLPFGPFSQIDPAAFSKETRAHVVQLQSELIRSAADAGIGIAVIHPSGEPYPESERAERLACAVDTVAQLTRVATECGMTLALENLPRTCLCRNSEEMQVFLTQIPELRVCFDTNHCLAEDNVHFIRAVGDKIVTLHVSDYDRIDEKHWLPGEGVNDWSAIKAALEEVGYRGRFLYETGGLDGCERIRPNYESLFGEQ